MLHFSVFWNTDALATSRLTSRPDAGFTRTPTEGFICRIGFIFTNKNNGFVIFCLYKSTTYATKMRQQRPTRNSSANFEKMSKYFSVLLHHHFLKIFFPGSIRYN